MPDMLSIMGLHNVTQQGLTDHILDSHISEYDSFESQFDADSCRVPAFDIEIGYLCGFSFKFDIVINSINQRRQRIFGGTWNETHKMLTISDYKHLLYGYALGLYGEIDFSLFTDKYCGEEISFISHSRFGVVEGLGQMYGPFATEFIDEIDFSLPINYSRARELRRYFTRRRGEVSSRLVAQSRKDLIPIYGSEYEYLDSQSLFLN